MNLKFWKKSSDLSFSKNIRKNKPPGFLSRLLSQKGGVTIAAVGAVLATEIVAGLTIGTAIVVVYAVASVAYSVYSMVAAHNASQARKSAGSGLGGTRNTLSSGHLINTRASDEPLAIPYGDCRLGGNLVYINSTGTTNEYLHIVMTLGEGPVDGIVEKTYETLTLDVAPATAWKVNDKITGATSGESCYIVKILTTLTFTIRDRTGNFTLGEILSNGIYTADQGAAHPVVSASSVDGSQIWLDDKLIGYYGTDATYEFFNGTSGQTVCATLQGYDANWDDAMRYTAYIYVRLHYNQNLFASMPQITVRLLCRKLYDPRNGSTAYSNNPALVAWDFLTNERYSIGISSSVLDPTTFGDAATWADANSYTFNGAIMNYQSFLDNLHNIFNNFRAGIVWSEGGYNLIVYEYDASVMTLTENEIVADSFRIIVPGIPETPNRVIVNYIDAVDNYLSKQRIIADNTAVLTYDQEERDFPLDLIGTTTATQAEKLGSYWVDRNRLNYQFTFSCSARALALEPLDMITVTHYLAGWSAAVVRVVDVKYTQGDFVQLTVVEEDSDLYDDTVNIATHAAYQTNLPIPTDYDIIVTANLVDNSVTTPKIVDNAVTYRAITKDESTGFALNSTAFTDVLTLGATAHGGEFAIDGRINVTNFTSTGAIYLQLTRGTTVIDGPITFQGSTLLLSNQIAGAVNLMDLDIPSTGAHTYKIQARNDDGVTATLKYSALKLCELLK